MDNELEKTANVENTVDTAEKDKQIKALEAEIVKLKQSVTNASADASKWKKQMQEKDDALKARMSEEEKAKAAQEASNAARDAELEELRTKWNVAEHEKQLISTGFDGELAKTVAESLKSYKPEELTVLFDGIRKFIATHDKELQAKSLMNNPVLSGGEAKKTMNHEEFDKMGYKDRLKLYNEDPELYKEMTKSS